MRAVILQPMYLPWMGYFGMVETADVFVHYDDVQFVRRSWQRRNKIKVPDGDFTWLTIPVEKDFGQRIDEVEIKGDNWRADHWKSIEHSYAGTSYFDDYAPEFEELYDAEWNRLVDLNVTIVERISDLLGVDEPEFRFSSDLDVEGKKTDRLIDVLEAVGADEYVSGPAAKDYLDTEQFEEAGIDLYWHEFDHPTYPQPNGEFVSHLSVVDLLFNAGDEALELIREGEADALEEAN